MAVARINKTGCGEFHGNVKVRIDLYLEPTDPRYLDTVVDILDNEGKVTGEKQVNPFHSHFVYLHQGFNDTDLEALMKHNLSNFYTAFQNEWDKTPGGMRHGWDTNTRIRPIRKDKTLDPLEYEAVRQSCEARISTLTEYSIKTDDLEGKEFPATEIDVGSAATDNALLAWMEREEMLFRTLERHIVAERLRQGFGEDVDIFISYSLGVQNRRKSRAGHALENHMEQVLKDNRINYTRAGETENRSKPDFIFPNIERYRDPDFPPARLTMLGVKSTCKDRWRQVLSEAGRINHKHLLTLQPGISENQTDEMQANSLKLVLPRQIHETYSESQANWLMDITAFLDLVKSRQTTN